MRTLKLLMVSGAVMASAMTLSTANAAAILSASPGTNPYSGPTPTYDFETAAPITGGTVVTGTSSGQHAQPYGSTGNYWAVGPTDGSPGYLDLSSFSTINTISFIWGSVDAYNTLQVIAKDGTTVLYSFTGADAAVNPNGNQTSPITNPLALLTFTGGDRTNIGGLRLSSTQNAFEVDNFAIGVPEASTWMMMILGVGLIGGMMRRRVRTTVSYA